MVGAAFPMNVSPAMLETAANEPLRAIDMVNGFSHSSLASKPSAPAPGFWLRGNGAGAEPAQPATMPQAGLGNLFLTDFTSATATATVSKRRPGCSCPVGFVVGDATR